MVRFRMLGLLRLDDSQGQQVSIRTPMERGLLAALLIGGRGLVSHDRIIRLLWDDPPASALDNVRQYAQRLRRYLKETGLANRLVTHRASRGGGGYSLRVEPGELDLQVFNDQVRAALGRVAYGDHDAAAEMLGQALSLWRGDAGEGTPHTAGLAASLAPIAERRLSAIEDYLAVRILRGHAAQAVADARRHVAACPTREQAWGLMMKAKYVSGDPAGAAEIYREAHNALVHHAGCEPTEALRVLHQAVLRNDHQAVGCWPLKSVNMMATNGRMTA